MRRFIRTFVAVLLVIGLIPCLASATEDAVAADGWSVDNDNYLGWSMEDGVITGDFNTGWENHEPIRLWKDYITDIDNFTLELEMTASSMTSPYLAVMGVRIEADGNNGDGNQVFLKSNNTEAFDGNNVNYDWIKAANCKVHITVWRIDGGDLTIRITGESDANVSGETKTLTVAPGAELAAIEVGVFRGCAQFGNLKLADSVEEIPEEPVVTVPTEPEVTQMQPTEPKGTAPQTTNPSEPAEGEVPAPSYIGAWIAIAAAVVIAVVGIVLVCKKRKT